MANDNELDLSMNVDASVDGGNTSAQLGMITEGGIDAATSVLALGTSVEYLNTALENLSTNKLSSLANLKPSDISKLASEVGNPNFNYYKPLNVKDYVNPSFYGTFKAPTGLDAYGAFRVPSGPSTYGTFRAPTGLDSYGAFRAPAGLDAYGTFRAPSKQYQSNFYNEEQTKLFQSLGNFDKFDSHIIKELTKYGFSSFPQYSRFGDNYLDLSSLKPTGSNIYDDRAPDWSWLRPPLKSSLDSSSKIQSETAIQNAAAEKIKKDFTEEYKGKSIEELQSLLREIRQKKEELLRTFSSENSKTALSNTEEMNALRNDLKNKRHELDLQIKEMRNAFEQEKREANSDLTRNYNNDKQEIENSYSLSKAGLKRDARTQLSGARADYEGQISRGNATKELQLNNLKDNLVNTITGQKTSIEELKNFVIQLNNDLKTSQDSAQSKLTEFKAEQSRQLAIFKENQHRELLKTDPDTDKRTELKGNQAKALTEFKAKQESERKKFESDLSKDASSISGRIAIINDIINKYNKNVEQIDKNFKDLEKEAQKRYQESENSIKESYRTRLSGIRGTRDERYSDLLNSFTANRDSLAMSFNERELLLNSKINGLNSNFNEEAVRRENKLKEEQLSATQKIKDAQNEEIDSRKREINAIEDTIRAKRREENEAKDGGKLGHSLKDAFVRTFQSYSDSAKSQQGIKGAIVKGFDQFFKEDSPLRNAFAAKDAAGAAIAGTGVNFLPIMAQVAITAISKFGKALFKFSQDALSAYEDIESIKTNLGIVYGTKSESDMMFNEISQYAVKSPFGVKQMSEFTVLLKQSGVYSSELMDKLKMIGDLAGGNTERMRNLATVYSRIGIMDKAYTRDLKQFATAGVPIYEALRRELKIDQKTLVSKVNNGEIDSYTIDKVLQNLTGKNGPFYNAVNRNAETYKARKQNLQDIKELNRSEWGDNWYNSWPFEKMKMSFQESWAEFNGKVPKIFNILRHNKEANETEKSYERLLSVYEKNIIAVNNNTASLDLFTNKIDDYFKNSSEKTRTARTEAYLNKATPLKNNLENYQNALEYFNAIPNKKDIFKIRFAEGTKAALEQQELQDIIYDLTGDSEFKSSMSASEIETYLNKKIKKYQKQLNKVKNDTNGDAFYETLGIKNATAYAEQYGTFAKDKKSSASLSSSLNTMYQASDAYKREKQIKDEQRLTEARLRYQKQQNIQMKSMGFDWMTSNNKTDNKGNVTTTLGTFDDVVNILKQNYNNNKLDLAAENINEDTFKTLKGNLDNLTNISKLLMDPEQQEEFEKNTKALRENLSKDRGSLSIGQLNKLKKELSKNSGVFAEWVNNLKDETFKTFMQALLILPEADLIDNKQLAGVRDKYVPFWKRYTASMLGVSIDGLKKGYSFSSQYTNLSYRKQNTAIARAMLNTMNAEDVFNGRLVQSKNGRDYIDQVATGKNYESFATSLAASAEITEAYLSKLTEQESQMKDFIAGAPFTAEDADKLYDESWASELGYRGKESFINAFNAATQSGTEAMLEFREATMKAISTTLKDVEAKKDEAKYLLSIKKAREDFQNKANETEIDTIIMRMVRNGGITKGLTEENAKNLLKSLVVRDKEGNVDITETRKRFNELDLGRRYQNEDDYSKQKTNYQVSKSEYERRLEEVQRKINKIYEKNHVLNASQGLDNKSEKEYWARNLNIPLAANQKPEDSLEYKSKVKSAIEASSAEAGPLIKERERLKTEINALKKDLGDLDSQIENFSKAQEDANNAVRKGVDYQNEVIANEYEKLYENLSKLNLSTGEIGGDDTLGRFSNGHPLWNILGVENTGSQKWIDNKGNQNTRLQQLAANFLNGGEQWEGSFSDFVNSLSAKDKMNVVKQYAEINPGQSIFDMSDLDTMVAKVGAYGQAIKVANQELTNLGSTMFQTLSSSLLDGMLESFKTLGKYLKDGVDRSEELNKAWKNIGANMMSSLGSAMAQCGLSIATNAAVSQQWGLVAAGLMMAGAGGIASMFSGMLEDDSDDKQNQEAERIRSLKDALSQLIDQAKTDAEYYQKNYLHRQALSENDNLSSRTYKVNDAIITPGGNIISTAPDDYLIATKTPDTLLNNNNNMGGVNIEFSPEIKIINQTSKEVDAEVNQSTDDFGNINIEVIIKDVVKQAIANGEMDDAMSYNQIRQQGHSVAW